MNIYGNVIAGGVAMGKVCFQHTDYDRFLKDYFPADTGGGMSFSDVKKKTYYYDAVKWAVANGITTGYTDGNGNPTGEFGPDDICTRAQIVTFIYRLLRDEWPQIVDTSGVSYKEYVLL